MAHDSYLFREERIPTKAAFPVVDAHNHLWAAWDRVDELVRIMNGVGVVIADPVEHTLTPATLQTSATLYMLLHHDAHLAAMRMDEAEAIADDYLDDENAESFEEWIWYLPVPKDHKLCPCHSC